MGVNLQVRIGEILMKNPVMVASGTAGYGPELADYFDLSLLGAFVVKGVALDPWLGNPYPRTAETASGMLNAIGLENPGVMAFIKEKLPFLRQFDVPIIVNVVGHKIAEYVEVVERLNDVDGIAAIEINISCPNVEKGLAFGTSPEGAYEIVSAIRAKTKRTLITKLSPNVTDIVPIAKAAKEGGSDALSLINTLIGTAIDAKTKKFKLANVTGGLSGDCIRPVAQRMVYQVAQAKDDDGQYLGLPIIGMGGISEGEHAVEFILAGANAVSVGTGTFIDPRMAVKVIEGIEAYLEADGTDDVNELVGAVKMIGD